MVMFDSLNRHMLPPYGCDWVHAPNFQRLAARSVLFDRCYAGSLPCIPARRELHTGRYNFLHRSWGPLEPFDDSMPELLKKNGIHTHLVSDHYHYWEDGGGTYHTRYNTWDFIRGQEGDPWQGDLRPLEAPITLNTWSKALVRQDWINRRYMAAEEDQPLPRTFARGLEFIRINHAEDGWFLTIEAFDPHEPYFCPQKYKDLYPHDYRGPHFDWPPYARVTQTADEVRHLRYECAALYSMCDAYLGKVLDLMDRLDLWRDTMLIVNTDHGYLLGEHGWWAKCRSPFYEEIAHIPLFIWDPRCGRRGERRDGLVQTIDLAPTLLDFFGLEIPSAMQGMPLYHAIANNAPVHEAVLFGIHGGQVNCTDGRYVYMRGPASTANEPLFEYTLMPMHRTMPFSLDRLREVALAGPFSFTKDCRVMRIKSESLFTMSQDETLLFDLATDPRQERPLQDRAIEAMMLARLVRLMRESDAPPEQFERLGLADAAMRDASIQA